MSGREALTKESEALLEALRPTFSDAVRESLAEGLRRIEAAAAREALESRLVLLAALGHIRSLSLVPHGSPEAFYRSQVSDAIATAQRAIDMDRAARASDGGR